ncbi:uncharacterized protein LOC110700284 isoform X1 [Chenopodium quinoa]|uniref:uncharacterized protein LOC110700284 isoform X1 n=1 Tax=Chenopodium quinoa TaxID=63459 RepID=UPI000B788409|nr:uncharacterized protein LOC110700284 isoform X1 [Chenopodium quinoa]
MGNPGDAVMLKISEDSVAQPGEKAATMVKFQGVDIRPDLLPILQKVWEKYEDVEGSRLQSCDIKAAALESLAKMIVILQTNNMESLTDDQANYLASTMSDLQFMQLKVDWLVPFVEKALSLQKQKHLETIMLELGLKR